MQAMRVNAITSRIIRRHFRTFDRQSFVKKNTERIELMHDAAANDKDSLAAKLNPEQKEYVDTIYETYFMYMPNQMQDKFYMYCLSRELQTSNPAEVLFDPTGVDVADLQNINDPIEEFYTVSKEFNKIVSESTKDIDVSKLSQSPAQQAVSEATAAPVEPVDQSKKRFKVDVVAIDAAKKLSIIKEVKAMLGIGLKDVS